MDFELTDDQEALREGVRSLCQGRFSIDDVRSLEAAGGVDRARWSELAETGVFALRLPEDAGGVGLGSAEAAIVFEELGRALVPGPLVGTHLAAGLEAFAADAVVSLVERASPAHVEHLASADAVAVVDDGGVWRVDATELRASAPPVEHPLDPLTPVHVVLELPQGERVGDAEVAARWRRDGAVLAAAQLVGIALQVTDLAVAYAQQREQFGRPIGSFQAVKHLCADMLVRAEVARVAVYAAGVTLDQPDVGDGDRAASVAKLMAGEAAIANAKSCIQVHGGMGFTWEVDAHLHLKRAWVLDLLLGSGDEHAEALAAVV